MKIGIISIFPFSAAMMKGAQLSFFEIFTLPAITGNSRTTHTWYLEVDVLIVVEPYLFNLNTLASQFNKSPTTYTWPCQAAV